MVDLTDVQGLTIQPYCYRRVRHLLFHCPQEADLKSFLRSLSDSIFCGNASDGDGPPTLTNLGLTASGLKATGMIPTDLAQFDVFFQKGPDPALTGDVSLSDSGPANWWEQQFGPGVIDLLVMVHSREADALELRTTEIVSLAQQFRLAELLPYRTGHRLEGQALTSGRLHFGYKDGITQPNVSWTDPALQNQVDFRNFLLGYANNDVYSAPGRGPVAELARNSTYLVLRWLYQDVARFQSFLRTEGKALAEHLNLSQTDAEELLAAKMLGRWRDGTPLEVSPHGPDDKIPNDATFDYQNDTLGQNCPFSSHIRVVNPRNQPLSPASQTEGVPRVIRRGIPYGPEMQSGVVEDDGVDRGLIGVFLCTSISRQFYKLMQWISHNDFSPVFENPHTQDPLFANRSIPNATQTFSFPLADGTTHQITGLPDFIRTKGTEFFLLPSLSMLRKLAQ